MFVSVPSLRSTELKHLPFDDIINTALLFPDWINRIKINSSPYSQEHNLARSMFRGILTEVCTVFIWVKLSLSVGSGCVFCTHRVSEFDGGSRWWHSERPEERWGVRGKENLKNFLLVCVFSVWKSRSWGWYPRKAEFLLIFFCFSGFLVYFQKNNKKNYLKKKDLLFSRCYESKCLPLTSQSGSERRTGDLRQILLSHWLQRFLPWHSVSSLWLQSEIWVSVWVCILCCL